MFRLDTFCFTYPIQYLVIIVTDWKHSHRPPASKPNGKFVPVTSKITTFHLLQMFKMVHIQLSVQNGYSFTRLFMMALIFQP